MWNKIWYWGKVMNNENQNSSPGKEISRRTFIGKSAAAVAAAGAFTIVPRNVLGGSGYTPPSDKLNIGSIFIDNCTHLANKLNYKRCLTVSAAVGCRNLNTIDETPRRYCGVKGWLGEPGRRLHSRPPAKAQHWNTESHFGCGQGIVCLERLPRHQFQGNRRRGRGLHRKLLFLFQKQKNAVHRSV